MSKSAKPITTFDKTIERANGLLNHYRREPEIDECNDLLRAAVILAVAGFDRYFTAKFCDVLVPHLKDEKRISNDVCTLLSDAGLDTRFALDLAVSKRPFRKIRTIVQNSLSKHTTQRTEIIDQLFIHFGLKDLMGCAQRRAERANLIKRTMKLVDMRNSIAHEAHVNTRGDPMAISVEDVESRIADLRLFVHNCNAIIDKRFGVKAAVSA